MLRPEINGPSSARQWGKVLAPVALIAAVAAVAAATYSHSLQGTDFPDFYCAARMLLDGQGHRLYDADLQRLYQASYAGRVGTLYIHPPFEAVLYLGVSWLPLQRAYLLWNLLNLAFLMVALWRLARSALWPWKWPMLAILSFAFVPVLLCLLQGQDSLLLFLVVVLGFSELRRDRPLAAGFWLGLGLFKFQLIVPLVMVLILTQRRRSAIGQGFGLVCLASLGASAYLSGWSVFIAYPQFLFHLRAQPFAGIAPQAMANFRGLTYLVFHNDRSGWAIPVTFVLSAIALAGAMTAWKRAGAHSKEESRTEFDLAFAGTVLFSLLVSYHLNPHDLTLLLLPIPVLLHRALVRSRIRSWNWGNDWAILILLAALFLPPLQVWALRKEIYAVLAVPMCLLLLVSTPLRKKQMPVGT